MTVLFFSLTFSVLFFALISYYFLRLFSYYFYFLRLRRSVLVPVSKETGKKVKLKVTINKDQITNKSRAKKTESKIKK
jgi:hypothetical protein